MGRVSRAQAQEHRDQVVTAAARLFRERGARNVSVADIMAAAGLTHGGFYRHFESKEALLTEATREAFQQMSAFLDGYDQRHPGDHQTARTELIEYYLSPEHRKDTGGGCPTAGLGPDMSREEPDSPARPPYAEGVEAFAKWLTDDSAGGPDTPDIATVCTLVGALILARATEGSDVSDRILDAARTALLD
jgi:TetR/AcrR family transcriptional regulator, transcriptional repressor for nem operon